jgi:predicted alpha-1,2-mannosidase
MTTYSHRIFAAIVILLTAYCSLLAEQTSNYTRWVNPFIGTGGHGHTFPGAVMPFGMVQLSPDTRGADWDGSSGYHYSDDVIYGFSHTHLSGTGIPDGCDILFMPTVGKAGYFKAFGETGVEWYASKFSHENERAEPGYYSVDLDQNGILAELTTTPRVGFHRYTFAKVGDAHVVLDLKWRDKRLDSDIKVNGNRVEGFRRSSSWAKDQIVYFAAEFSRTFSGPSVQAGVADRGGYPGQPASTVPVDDHYDTGKYQVVFNFNVRANEQILLKVAISSVSIEGARKNLEAELPGWDFDKVRADAKAAWNKALSKIEVSGGTPDQMTTFYTALYHTMIHPSLFSDVDGNYRGIDGKVHNVLSSNFSLPGSNKKPAKAGTQNASNQYSVFSLWDTFRAAHPLYTIIDQKRTADFINTFIRMYEQGGRLPVWELWGNETDTMIGYHAVSVIADAMAKNIKGFDYEKAYAAAKHSAELDRDGLAAYKRRGYISSEDENESVSKTLEYAYDDWCIASMGSMLFNRRSLGSGKDLGVDNDPYLKKLSTEIDYYRRRAGNFENLFDTQTRFFRPKKNGGFVTPFEPQDVTFNYTEGNAWQYSFFVPHDVSRLIQLMGGTSKFVQKLDELFTTSVKLSGREQPDITGLIGQYAHGNEPSHHIAYLYDYVGQPSKTQKYVRQIMDNFYKDAPDGLIGNEDCGQMSAWYVLSASGFYPVVPGQTRYDMGTPLFKQVIYHLENGKTFTIKAPKVSATNIYINSAKWNGRPQLASYIVQEQIMAGGVLELEMSSTPNDKAFESVSTSTVYQDQAPVPIIDGGGRVFDSTATITLSSTAPRATILYTLDGSVPGKDSLPYTAPFTINKTTTIKAIALVPSSLPSLPVEATYHKKSNDWTVKIDSMYNRQYTGGGDAGLIDGIRGSVNFASGEWQGYQGQDFIATIDMQTEMTVSSVGGGFLQVARSWIWMPTHIVFETSTDGMNFTKVADIKTDVAAEDLTPTTRDYHATISPTRARFVRVHAYNLGTIPLWHPGAGGDAFIFVDEILID